MHERDFALHSFTSLWYAVADWKRQAACRLQGSANEWASDAGLLYDESPQGSRDHQLLVYAHVSYFGDRISQLSHRQWPKGLQSDLLSIQDELVEEFIDDLAKQHRMLAIIAQDLSRCMRWVAETFDEGHYEQAARMAREVHYRVSLL